MEREYYLSLPIMQEVLWISIGRLSEEVKCCFLAVSLQHSASFLSRLCSEEQMCLDSRSEALEQVSREVAIVTKGVEVTCLNCLG